MSMWKKTGEEDTFGEPTTWNDPPKDASSTAKRPVARQAAPGQSASIGPSIEIKGDISGNEDLIVHGKVEGTLSLPKNNVVVGADGTVQANVNAMNISVEGNVIGDLTGSERVVITGSGRVKGNITAPRVVLEDGAQLKGSIDMNVSEAKASAKPSVSTSGDKDKVTEVKRMGVTHTN